MSICGVSLGAAIKRSHSGGLGLALMIACCVHTGDLEKAKEHMDYLRSFAPDFIPSVLGGDMTLYKDQRHNAAIVDALRGAARLAGPRSEAMPSPIRC